MKKRKRKKHLKVKILTMFFLAVSFLSVTLAWFAYSGLVSGKMDLDIKAWYIEFNGLDSTSNEIVISLDEVYPGMETVLESIVIRNKGDSDAKLNYNVKSIRIFDNNLEVTKEYGIMEDKLTNDYPFSIDITYGDRYIYARSGETIMDISFSWPLDSDRDNEDSYWGNLAYDFHLNENTKPESQRRSSLKMVIQIQAEQNIDKFTYNSARKILYNPVNDNVCAVEENDCYSTYLISPNYNNSQTVLLLPSFTNDFGTATYDEYVSKVNIATDTWTSEHEYLDLKNILSLVNTDITNTKLIRKIVEDNYNLSDEIVGYISKEERFETFIQERVIKIIEGNPKYESKFVFSSEKFKYLNEDNKCYWLNYEYDSTRAFALKKDSEGKMKIYPENKDTRCNVSPVIKLSKEKFYEAEIK